MRTRILIAALLALPSLALAQTTPATSADIHALHNDIVFEGNGIIAALKALPAPADPTAAVTALGPKLDKLDTDLLALTAAVKASTTTNSSSGSSTSTAGTTPTTGATTATTALPATASQASITVGPGQQFTEIADAVPFAAAGATITVLPGTYLKSWDESAVDNVTFVCSVPVKCIVDGQGGYGAGHRMAWGKSMFHFANVNATVVGFHFVNAGSPASGTSYSNEAAIYFEGTGGKTLTARNNAFDNNANGVFSDTADGSVVVDSNVFGYKAPNGMNAAATGASVGPAHDMYLVAHSVEVKGNYFYGAVGHNVKTRADLTNVHDNPLMTYDGGRVADICEGGAFSFTGNAVWSRDDSTFPARTIQSGLTKSLFGNSNLLAYADENTNHGAQATTVSGNTFHLARLNSTAWAAAGSIAGSGNKFDLVGGGSLQTQGTVTGDLTGMSALPTAAAHAIAPPAPPSWFQQ